MASARHASWILAYGALLLLAARARAADPAAAPNKVLRLEDALRTAQEHQPTLREARATTRAAGGRTTQAGAGLLPQVSASATYQRIHGNSRIVVANGTTTMNPTGVAAPTSGPLTYNSLSAGVSVSQLIWDFGQTIDRRRAASRAVDAARASEHETELQVAANVRTTFFEARAQHALTDVAQQTLDNEQRHLQQIQAFVNAGTRPSIDLAQAKADVANAQVSLINTRNDYAIAKARLNQAMGITGPIDFDVADEELEALDGEDLPTDTLTRQALENRPQLQALTRQQEADELTIQSIKGAYGPTLSATGGVFEAGRAFDELGLNWNIGASLVWPIFQGGITNGQLDEARANLDNSHAQMEEVEAQIRVDVEQAALSVAAARAALESSAVALDSASERLRLAEGRYASGTGSIIERSDAQVGLSSSQAQAVVSHFNLSSARAQLMAALGRR